jgi:hypothetical protein
VGLAFAAGFFVAEGLAESGCAELELGESGAEVSVDCAAPDRATINNPSRTTRRPEARRRRDNGEEKPNINTLYADLRSTVTANEPVT